MNERNSASGIWSCCFHHLMKSVCQKMDVKNNGKNFIEKYIKNIFKLCFWICEKKHSSDLKNGSTRTKVENIGFKRVWTEWMWMEWMWMWMERKCYLSVLLCFQGFKFYDTSIKVCSWFIIFGHFLKQCSGWIGLEKTQSSSFQSVWETSIDST